MTDHERLMLRRHLERAAREYDRRRDDLFVDLPEGPCRLTAAKFYEHLALEARDFAARLKEKAL